LNTGYVRSPMNESPQQRYVRLLLERVQQVKHPSPTDLDRIEQAIRTREEASAYLAYLFERVEETQRPSPQILNRIERILG
jgi:hypothetical protein